MNARIVLILMGLALFSGCLQPQFVVQSSRASMEYLNQYAHFLQQPSEKSLLDLLITCSEEGPHGETLLVTRDCLLVPDSVITNINGIEYSTSEIALACFTAMTGSAAPLNGLRVKAIISRYIDDTTYRYHIYNVEPSETTNIYRVVSIWIDGYFAGKANKQTILFW